MPKDLLYTESQKSRKRQQEGENNPTASSSRRKLTIEDAPGTLRVLEGELMNELPDWLNTNVISSLQQLKEASLGTSHGVAGRLGSRWARM